MRRWTLLLLFMIGRTVSLNAQDILCNTGDTLHAPVTLTAANIEIAAGVSAASSFIIGTSGSVLPLAQVTTIGDQAVCVQADSAIPSPILIENNVTVPFSAIVTTPENADANTLIFGTAGDQGDVLTVIVENQAFDGSDDYVLSVTDAMRASGVPLEIRAYGLTDTDIPRLEVRTPNGNPARQDDLPLTCENGEPPCVSLLDTAIYTLTNALQGKPTDAGLRVDLAAWQEDTLRLRVTEAAYVLVLRLANDAPPLGFGQAILTYTNGQWSLSCDGVQVWSDGLALRIEELSPSTSSGVTVLGAGAEDPILVTRDATTCTDDSPDAQSTALTLPDMSVLPNETSARVSLAANQTAVMGLRDDQPGIYLIVLENVPVDADGTVIELITTAGMVAANDVLTVWATASDSTLDTRLSWVTADNAPVLDFNQQPYTCDNVGAAEGCAGQTVSLLGSSVTLGNERVFPFGSTDSTLTIPIFADTATLPLRVQVAGANNTRGTAIIILRVVVG